MAAEDRDDESRVRVDRSWSRTRSASGASAPRSGWRGKLASRARVGGGGGEGGREGREKCLSVCLLFCFSYKGVLYRTVHYRTRLVSTCRETDAARSAGGRCHVTHSRRAERVRLAPADVYCCFPAGGGAARGRALSRRPSWMVFGITLYRTYGTVRVQSYCISLAICRDCPSDSWGPRAYCSRLGAARVSCRRRDRYHWRAPPRRGRAACRAARPRAARTAGGRRRACA